MTKGLEALNRIGNCYIPYESRDLIVSDTYGEDYDIVEKELKALEIIKKKSVWGKNVVNEVKTSKDYTEYAMNYGILHWSALTKEEFYLLKEVFENKEVKENE